MPSGANERISRAFQVAYCGFSVLDFNYSTAAFRWVVGELSYLAPFGREEIELEIARDNENGKLKLLGTRRKQDSGSNPLVLEHDLHSIWKLFTWLDNECSFAYLFRTDPDYPLTCHAFCAKGPDDAKQIVKFLHQSMKRKGVRWSEVFETPSILPEKNFAMVPESNVPLSECSSSSVKTLSVREKIDSFASQFEVLYLCRAEVNGSSPCSWIVDEAARRYDEEYKTTQARDFVTASVKQLIGTDRTPPGANSLRTQLRFSETEADDWDESSETQHTGSTGRRRRKSSLMVEALVDSVFLDDVYGCSPPWSLVGRKKSIAQGCSTATPSFIDLVKIRASSDRSMLMMIGQWDVSLISLSRKEELLRKKLTEISFVIQGSKYPNHFAFVCPDNWHGGRSDCYVIRCQDGNIASSAIRAMRTAFTVAFSEHASSGGRQHVCDRCPLFQYSCLCSEIDGFTPKQINDVVSDRVNQLPSSYRDQTWAEYKKLSTDSEKIEGDSGDRCDDTKGSDQENIQRKNVILMSVLRSVCEGAQLLHARSVGKAVNSGGNNGNSIRPSMAMSENEIYLDAVESSDSASSTLKREKRQSGDASSSATFHFGSAANKLVSLRDRAKIAFGGSLDSILKRKPNDVENNGDRSTSKDAVAVPSSDGEGDADSAIILYKAESGTGKLDAKGTHHISASPPTPRSPAETMASSQATFHFETPDRRGSDSDICYRPRSCTVGDLCSGKPVITSKHAVYGQDRPTPFAKYPRSNDLSNSSLMNMATSRGRRMSWRQAIFTRVVSPRLFVSRHSVAGLGLLLNDAALESRRSSATSNDSAHTPSSAHGMFDDFTQTTPYRSLWKKAIMEQILALRLENQKKVEGEKLDEIRKLKLTYEEITPCSEDEVRPIWLEMLNHPKRHLTRFDRVRLEEAVKAGVPRDLRSEVWKFLMSQHLLDRSKRAQMEMPPAHRYRDLLKDLTSYQHAILIDLGRTFPSHNYFSQPLGPGQLSLFNILKAYSLFDTEVGYCQGLSFIAGVLLLHMDEEDAFEMLVDMMYRMQLRKQYRPDMLALQIEMYQLSRLLHDRHKDLHLHLEEHEIPILYAAPWFLTLFASAFPLGFVARVFDFVFLAGGLDVVFKIALILLGDHKELIKNCDSFESINDFLKTTLPSMSIIQMERVFNQVFELDISRELLAYEVEYHVLQEEVLASPAGVPLCANMSLPVGIPNKPTAPTYTTTEFSKLETANKFLKRQNMELLEQLQEAHYKLAFAEKVKLELEAKLDATTDTLSSCQCKVTSLERRVEALEFERKSLLSALQRVNGCSPDPRNDSHPKTNGTAMTTPSGQRNFTNSNSSGNITHNSRLHNSLDHP